MLSWEHHCFSFEYDVVPGNNAKRCEGLREQNKGKTDSVEITFYSMDKTLRLDIYICGNLGGRGAGTAHEMGTIKTEKGHHGGLSAYILRSCKLFGCSSRRTTMAVPTLH